MTVAERLWHFRLRFDTRRIVRMYAVRVWWR